jgi:tRNA(Ile)-lysidine synthase
LVDCSLLVLKVGCGAVVNWIQIKTNLLRRCSPDERYLIGVSGGRDSVALLHWLINLGYKELTVCHLNHQLRGRSSDTDARFVQKLVARYSEEFVGQARRLPGAEKGKRSARPTIQTPRFDFELNAANVRALAKKKKMSIETAAREARYSFFAKVAKRHRCHTIFLAHHADDLVETFLLNLIRGTGMTGLAAMPDVSTRPVDNVDLTIVRPFLSVWRTEIDDYVDEHRLKFREDASNKNLGPMRNRARNRIIPYLEKIIGRNVRRNIWRTAIIAADEENWIDNAVPDSTNPDLLVSKLRALPVPLQRRAILKWLRAQNISELGFEVIESVRSLVDREASIAKVNLPRDRHVRRRAGKIFVE